MFKLFSRTQPPSPLDSPLWPQLARQMALLQGLGEEEHALLKTRMRRFLAKKSITTAHDLPLDDEMRLTIAAQACLPILNLDDHAYDDWAGVVLYPDAFVTSNSWTDGAGLVHEGQSVLIGMARGDGPMLLSWPDSKSSPALDGYNVVIHECAHKLDMRNGYANGSPPLHAGMSQAAWTRAFAHSYDDFCWRVRHGYTIPVDPYAAQSPAEFFAVLSEGFFENPHVLAAAYPEVYQQLMQFYRQDPRRRLPAPLPATAPDH